MTRVEIHHFVGLHPLAMEIPARLELPFEVVVHDYSWFCPRITLIAADRRYCGEPDIAACEACVAANGSLIEEEIAVADLRARTDLLFRHATHVTVSCQDVAQRFSRYVPGLPWRITPWEEPIRVPAFPAPRRWAHARVGLIGAIGEHKGYFHLLDCAQDAAARDLPLDFVVIGYTEDDPALFATGRVFVTGKFEEDEVAALLELEGCNALWFPSIYPETWSYALSQGLRSGLPVIAYDLGAFSERLRDVDRARLISPDSDIAALNAALIAAAGPRAEVSLRTRDLGEA